MSEEEQARWAAVLDELAHCARAAADAFAECAASVSEVVAQVVQTIRRTLRPYVAALASYPRRPLPAVVGRPRPRFIRRT